MENESVKKITEEDLRIKIRESLKKHEKKDFEISLYDLNMRFQQLQENIDQNIASIRNLIFEKEKLYGTTFSLNEEKELYFEIKNIVLYQKKLKIEFCDSNQSFLEYEKIGRDLCLVRGPEKFDHFAYLYNEWILSFGYQYLKNIYDSLLIKQLFSESFTFSDGIFSFSFQDDCFKMVSIVESESSINGNVFFQLEKRERNQSRIVCGIPEIIQMLHENKDDFLKGYYIDEKILPNSIQNCFEIKEDNVKGSNIEDQNAFFSFLSSHKERKEDQFSLYEIMNFMFTLAKKIDHLKSNFIERWETCYCERIPDYKNMGIRKIFDEIEKVYRNGQTFLKIDKLYYKTIDGIPYLKEGPSDLNDASYDLNQLLMTEEFEFLKEINLFYELYYQGITLRVGPFEIILTGDRFVMKSIGHSQRAMNENWMFYFVKQRSKINIDLCYNVNYLLVCGMPDVTQLFSQHRHDCLQHIYVDHYQLSEDIVCAMKEENEEKVMEKDSLWVKKFQKLLRIKKEK